MKASYLAGLGRFAIRQLPDPTIVNDTDVLVKVKAVGVCGSDIHYFTAGRIGSQVVAFPFILGHESAGTVQKIGTRVTRVAVGQNVAIDPAISCGRCDQCKAGRVNTCRTLRFMGAPGQMEGCLREFVVIPEQCCYPVPDTMTCESAALAEPLAIAVYAVDRSPLTANATVAILGVGPIGLCVLHVLRTRSAGSLFVTDRIEERLAHARKLNPLWTGNPGRADIVRQVAALEPSLLDIVFECSGDPAAIVQGIDLLKPGGTLVIVGISETDAVPFPVHELRRKEITVLNIRRQAHCTQKAIDLMAQRRISLDEMITHRFSLEDTQQAFELVAQYRDGVMKAMISMD